MQNSAFNSVKKTNKQNKNFLVTRVSVAAAFWNGDSALNETRRRRRRRTRIPNEIRVFSNFVPQHARGHT